MPSVLNTCRRLCRTQRAALTKMSRRRNILNHVCRPRMVMKRARVVVEMTKQEKRLVSTEPGSEKIQLPTCLLRIDDIPAAATECVPMIIRIAVAYAEGNMPYPPHDPYTTKYLNTRTSPVTDADAWTDPDVIMSWNVWGLAPINAVLAEGVAALTCDLMGIFWDKPFLWRQFVDDELLTNAAPGNTSNEPTFFAISGYQESFSFGPTTCESVTHTRDGFIDYQDRLFRAQDKRGAPPLFDGWRYQIGTKNSFPQFDGTEAAVGPGLFLMSTHEPFAYGFSEFEQVPPDSFDDNISMKGITWAHWKNQDSSKGVLGFVTHFLTFDSYKGFCLDQLSQLMVTIADEFAGETTSLDVYVFGDFNWNPDLLQSGSQVFQSLTYLTDGTGPTVQDGGTLDSIWGGKYLGNGEFGSLDASFTFGVADDGTWTVGGSTPPNYYTSLSDHKMVWTAKNQA